jgi:hypothetical protein
MNGHQEKGPRFGNIAVDLERRTVIDILARTNETVPWYAKATDHEQNKRINEVSQAVAALRPSRAWSGNPSSPQRDRDANG